MKLFAIITTFIQLTLAAPSHADDQGNLLSDVDRMAPPADVTGLIALLPKLETIAETDKVAYMKAMEQVISPLMFSDRSDAWQTAFDALPRVMEKKLPQDPAKAIEFLDAKMRIYRKFNHFQHIRRNRAHLLQLADFLADVRAARIPGYQNRGTNVPAREILDHAGVNQISELPTQELKDEAATAIKKNNDDLVMNHYQTFLNSMDSEILMGLRSDSKVFYSPNDASNKEFYKELFRRAGFNKAQEEEFLTR